MMACNQWNDQWVARLYDELDPDEDRRAGEHLDDCPACRETMEALAGTRRLLRESAPAVPPAPRVVVLQPRRQRRTAWAFAAGVAAAAMLFAVALTVIPRTVVPGAASGEIIALETRIAELEQAATASNSGLNREQFDAELARWARRVEVGRARDVEYLLSEITAAERRTGNYINNNSEALLRVALASNKPGLSQH
jgi:predicted anti-sigma-YlaC factor YlaD